MNSTKVAIGPLTVSFAEDPFCRNLLNTMYGKLSHSESDIDVQIEGHDWRETAIPHEGITRASDRILTDGDTHYIVNIRSYSPPKKWVVDHVGQHGYALVIDGWDSDILSIDVYYDGTLYENGFYPIRYYLKFRDRTFANYRDKLAKNFVYGVLEPLWQAWMISQETTFLHASSLSINGRGIALTGWGGSGKTSASSALIRNSEHIKFLSDDLAIITSQGEIYPYYKSSVIYPYNTAGDTLPKSDFLNGFSDQFQWKLREWKNGKKGVRRRVPPEKLFAGQVGRPGSRELEKVVYLSREKREYLDHEWIASEEMARRSTAVILDELDWLIEYSSAICATGSMSVVPQNIVERTEGIYRNCFDSVETVLLHIPMNSGPNELADYLVDSVVNE